MTRRRYLLPILVLAALAGPAGAAQVTLTDAWQNLGTGPLLLQTQGGDGLFEASATAPTDNGVALGKNQVPFSYNSSLAIWGKRRAQARTNTGAPLDTTVTTTPLTATGGGSGSSTTANQGAAGTSAWPVTEQDSRATAQTLSAAQGSFVDIPLNGAATVGLRFSGLAASGATVTYYSSNDATQAPTSPISSLNAATGVTSPTRTTDGETRVPVSGRTTLRLQVTTGGTGSITVSYNVSTRAGIVDFGSPIPPGSNTIGSIGNTAFGISGQLPAGTNIIGAVTQSGGPWAVSWTNQTVGITGTVQLGAGSAAIGSVSVSNFPTTQQVAGTVSVGNLPTSYPDTLADTALGAPGDAAPLPGASASIIGQLKTLIAQSASYTSAGTATASGTLPNPATMPAGGAPRGFAYSCDGTTPANSKTTLTLSGGGTTPLTVATNTATNTGMSATAATAVTGCTFQALY